MRRNSRTTTTALAVGGVLLLAAGCGGTGDGGGQEERRTASGTVEQLAEKASCEPDIQIDADELRQGICGKGGGRYVLTTFATHKGQQDWLSEAQAYGGSYLVGPKWVAVGDPKVLAGVRDSLGGEVETAPSHGGTEHSAGPGHSGGPGHSAGPGHSGDAKPSDATAPSGDPGHAENPEHSGHSGHSGGFGPAEDPEHSGGGH